MTFLVVWANAGVGFGVVEMQFTSISCIALACSSTNVAVTHLVSLTTERVSCFLTRTPNIFILLLMVCQTSDFFCCLLLVVVFLLFLVKVSRLPSGGGHFRAAIKLNWIIAAHIVLMHARTVANDPFKSLQSVFGAKDNGTEQPQVS